MLGSWLILHLLSDWGQNIQLFWQVVTKQINLEDEIEQNEILMGITDVQGKGIVIHVLDGNDLIHQEDLIILIDELKNAGAQAISINDIRITSCTYLYCDGSVILIDGNKIGNPFTIKAIGNVETLYGAIMRNKGYIHTLERDNLEINVEKNNAITIAKTNLKSLLEYSKNKTRIGTLLASNQFVGKTFMTGKGLHITIQENKVKLSALSFLQMINDLRAGGARAMMINGNRITNLTDIVDISSTYILVNSIPLKAPYTIEVIGNPEKLLENLNYANSYLTKIKTKGNIVEVQEKARVTIVSYESRREKNKFDIEYLKNN